MLKIGHLDFFCFYKKRYKVALMKITEIQIVPIKNKNGLVAIANLVFDNSLYLSSIGIHRRRDDKGYRLTYPTKKIGNSSFNIYHPINKVISKEIEDKIFSTIAEFNKVIY